MADGNIPDELNKAERLALAAAVAPVLRGADAKAKNRRVALTDADGNVTGYTTLGEVQKSLLRRREIEIDVQDGKRPTEIACCFCGKPVPRGTHQQPRSCRNVGGCHRQKKCAGRGCTKRPNERSFKPAAVRSRSGRPWRCRACNVLAMNDVSTDEKSKASLKRNISPKRRSEIARKANAAMTRDQRVDNARKAYAAMTSEQRCESARRARAGLAAKRERAKNGNT